MPVGAGVAPVGPGAVTAYVVALHHPPGRMPKYLQAIKTQQESKPMIETTTETITPEQATEILARHNPRNRRIKKTLVQQLSHEMTVGHWHAFNGDTIVFDENGNLIDGQHRLSAAIHAQVPLRTLVVRGVDPASLITKDVGIKRTLADILKIEGYQNNAALAATIRGTLNFQLRSGGLGHGGYLNPSLTDCLEWFKKYETPLLTTTHMTAAPSSTEYGLRIPRMVLFEPVFAALAAGMDEEASEYVKEMTDAATEWQIMQSTRNQLIKSIAGRVKLSSQWMMTAGIRSWNCFVTGQDVQKLHVRLGKPVSVTDETGAVIAPFEE